MLSLLKKWLITLSILIIALLVTFFLLLEQQMNKPIELDSTTLLTIKPGVTISSFSKQLVKKGWLAERFWIRNYARIYTEYSNIKVGTYQIPAKITSLDLLKLLISGKEHQFSITFIEGSTFKQWLAIIAAQPQLKHQLTKLSIQEIAKLLAISSKHPEGWFFPETYAFTAGTSDLQILQRAHTKMKKELQMLWQQRQQNLPYETPYQALIMASILEKETSLVEELPLVSSVFVNRLAKKMRLQTDPTVIYGLGDRYQGNITRKHLREKTLYNTYRINGLPPTPIAMPGFEAISAVMHPSVSDYLYFVSTGQGSHIFSTTLSEHNKAVRQYQLTQKN